MSATTVELPDGSRIQELLHHLAGLHGANAAALLLAGDRPQPTILAFVNDAQADAITPLAAGDDVVLLTPIAGGGGGDA